MLSWQFVCSGRTQCLKSQFWITSDAGSSPTICGENTGYHMIVTARSVIRIGRITVMKWWWWCFPCQGWLQCSQPLLDWGNPELLNPSVANKVSIWIFWRRNSLENSPKYFSCTASWRPNTDCLQWFTGTSGYVLKYWKIRKIDLTLSFSYIYSYNYNGGYHLADQVGTSQKEQVLGSSELHLSFTWPELYLTIIWPSLTLLCLKVIMWWTNQIQTQISLWGSFLRFTKLYKIEPVVEEEPCAGQYS